MTWLLPIERQIRLRRRLLFTMALLVLALAAVAVDPLVFHSLYVGADRRQAVEGKDWYQFLRTMGYWPFWMALWGGVALALNAAARARSLPQPSLRPTIGILLAPGLAGFAAEIIKLVFGRQRPINNGVEDGAYVFKPVFYGFIDGSNLGMPSSHAAVAFGGACAIAMLVPGSWAIAMPLAIGCGLTRMLSGAHFFSDVVVGAMVGYAVARALRPGGWRGSDGPPYLP